MKIKVHSLDVDTDFFDIVAGVFQGDRSARYRFIICLDLVFRTWIDLIKENSFTLKKGKEKTISGRNYDRDRLWI